MPGEPKMRLPYGPGWEDSDWAPHEPPPEAAPAVDARPVVRSLAQFMDVVRRVARPRRPAVEVRGPALPTRRWVVAGGAGLVALVAFRRRPALGTPPREAANDDPPPTD